MLGCNRNTLIELLEFGANYRMQGKITYWNDDREFGFIQPEDGREQIFAHIKAFENTISRPLKGQIVRYEISFDPKGRARAERAHVKGVWPGAIVAQQILRHKSKKISFRIVLCMTIFLNCTLLGWLLSPVGVEALSYIEEFNILLNYFGGVLPRI